MKSLRQRVAIKMSDIQRTIYKGDSCFNIDTKDADMPDRALDEVDNDQECFLSLADVVIAMVKRDIKKNQKPEPYCDCSDSIQDKHGTNAVAMCCYCGNIDIRDM